MPICRATFFFKDTNNHGWTETIHSLKADLTSTLTAAKALLTLRVECLGSTAALDFVRVSDDLVKRDSKIYKVPARDGTPKSLGIGNADIANTCLVVRLDANPLTRRTLYMRGVPDAIVDFSGVYTPSPSFRTAFDAWLAQLKSDGWACRGKDGTIVPAVISLITQNPVTGQVTISTATPHGFAVNQAVTIKGVKGATSVNGSWNVFNVLTTTSFTIQTNVLLANWLGGGTVSRLGFTLAAITDGVVMRCGERKAGRFFDSPVGRRRARKVH